MSNVCDYGENIVGPFKQTVFLGCSVKSFGCNVGWNQQVTNLTVELVEDPCPGDKVYYNKPGHQGTWTEADPGFEAYQPSVGAPVYFRVGLFEFAGVVQGWNKRDDTAGLNQYTVNISDPRFLLQNTQVITNEFDGSVGPIYNVINPFGFLESYGFGISDVNEVGVPWGYIKVAASSLLTSQTSLEGNAFSPHGGVVFRSHDWNNRTEKFGLLKGTDTFSNPNIVNDYGGEHGWVTTYYVDLHDIPFSPDYYRLQSPEMTILDMVNQVCEDAGCDYYVELFVTFLGEKVIKIKTQQRRQQPTLGRIQEFVDTRTGVVSKNVGRELRNEATQSFSYGANKQYFVEQSSYEPWWGFDTEGEPQTWGTVTDPAGVLGTMYFVNLDVRELNTTLATALGSDSIVVTEGEMRCALGGFGSWQNYIQLYNSGAGTITGQWAAARGFKPTFKIENFAAGGDNQLKANNQIGGMFPNLANFSFDASQVEDAKKIHAFISQFADEFYGKKALVPMNVDYYFNQESLTNIFEALPASEAWVEDGGTWLGITKPSVYLDQFTSEENLTSAGVRHSASTAYIRDAGNAITNGTYIWLSASVEPDPIIKAPAAGGDAIVWAILNFSSIAENKVQENGVDSFMSGGAISIESFNGTDIEPVLGGFGMGIGADVSLGMSLKRVYPQLVALPLRSSYSKYGAFGYVGPPGTVLMKPDESLSPWSYGGTTTMNAVADAQNTDGLTFMQVGERGSVTWPGYPEHRIGSELRSSEALYTTIVAQQFPWSITNNNGSTGTQHYTYLDVPKAKGDFGPNITSIAVNIAQGGVTTTYELSTFTPSFGRMSRINTERLKMAAKNRVRMSRMARKQAFMKMYTQLSRNRRF